MHPRWSQQPKWYVHLLGSVVLLKSIRGNPIDAVVLLGGCDKTTPGQLMGAASVDLPTIVVSSGPMLNGKLRGRDIGSGTDVWKFSEAVRAGQMTVADFMAAESGMSRSPGTCMTMGSASTFASVVEAMGIALPYNATAPAVSAQRRVIAHEAGRQIVRLAPKASGSPPSWTEGLSRTPSGSSRRSAARPTRSCTCWRSRGGSASRCG